MGGGRLGGGRTTAQPTSGRRTVVLIVVSARSAVHIAATATRTAVCHTTTRRAFAFRRVNGFPSGGRKHTGRSG